MTVARSTETGALKNVEERVCEFLRCLDFEEAKIAEEWVKSFGTITCAYR